MDAPLMITGPLFPAYCPHGAITQTGENEPAALNREICAGCVGRECVTVNRNNHLVCRANDIPLDEILKEARECRPMFFDGGGVTFTGGEPTLQMPALKELLPLLRSEDIHTALETNGTSPELESLFPYIDFLMMDFKQPHDDLHRKHTGVGNTMIKENIRKAIAAGLPLHVRIPLIHGVNDSSSDLEGFIEFFTSLGPSGPPVEILPYHEYGKEKWAQCGLEYKMENGHLPEGAAIRFADAIKRTGIRLVRT